MSHYSHNYSVEMAIELITITVSCRRCVKQNWCVCQEMVQIHKTSLSKHDQCLCCVFRARTVDEFKRVSSSKKRDDMKQKAEELLEAYKNLK